MTASWGSLSLCLQKSTAGFKGVLKGGRMIVFDAKHTDSDRVQYSAITDEQRVCLEHCAAMGAEAGVLVSFGFARCYMIPWDIWRGMKKQYGRKYMLEDEAGPYEVKNAKRARIFPGRKGGRAMKVFLSGPISGVEGYKSGSARRKPR